jgi:hypothetical protein
LENTLDNFSEFERFMIADRMRRGKRSKAKQGKLVACPQSDYGFRYNDARDGYEVAELKMAVIRRIFRMVGVEGMSLNAVANRLMGTMDSSSVAITSLSLGTLTAGWILYGARCVKVLGSGTKSMSVFI